MAIHDKRAHKLFLDYSSMFDTYIHPIDLDMWYIATNGAVVIGEVKNESYKVASWESQKKYMTEFLDRISGEVICLFIVHDKYWQKGDKEVDVPSCEVKEYYYKKKNQKGVWVEPKKTLYVREIFEKYEIS